MNFPSSASSILGISIQHSDKKELSHIELKIIKNNHYVYRATSEWDKERKKVKKITEYIGGHRFKSQDERFLSMEMARLPII